MIEPFFRTIIEYEVSRCDGGLRVGDKVLLQSNGEYIRIAFSDPCLCRQIKRIQIPIELLLLDCKRLEYKGSMHND